MDRTDTLAIVITYKAPELLKRCLSSIPEIGCDIFVVDNSEDNILYTRAVNKGLKRAQECGYKYALICCDDVVLGKDCVSSLVSVLEIYSLCALACPVSLCGEQVTFGGGLAAFPGGIHIGEVLSPEPYETPWANGACFMLRLSAVRECGLLDENMRFICSDSDYSFLLRSRGHKVLMCPDAKVQHELKQSATPSTFIGEVMQKDQQYFIAKWLTGGLYANLSYEGKSLEPLVQRQYADLSKWVANPPRR